MTEQLREARLNLIEEIAEALEADINSTFASDFIISKTYGSIAVRTAHEEDIHTGYSLDRWKRRWFFWTITEPLIEMDFEDVLGKDPDAALYVAIFHPGLELKIRDVLGQFASKIRMFFGAIEYEIYNESLGLETPVSTSTEQLRDVPNAAA